MYRDIEEDEQSPTDTSEDSIEVEVKPIKSAMASNTNTGKKNKRKSQEPKRLATTDSDMKRCRLNSTGSEDRSPPVSYNSRSPSPPSPTSKSSSSSSSSSPVSSKRSSLSPMCLAPKKRFKFDALRDLEQLNSEVKEEKAEPEKDSSKSPFRPWSREGSALPAGEPSKTTPPAAPASVPPYIPFLLPGLRHPGMASMAPILPLYPYLPPYLALPHQSHSSPSSLSPASPGSSPPPPQEEPLSLVMTDKKKEKNNNNQSAGAGSEKAGDKTKSSPIKAHAGPTLPPVFNVEALMKAQKVFSSTNILQSPTRPHRTGSPASPGPTTPSRVRNDSGSTSSSGGEADKAKQRNYKNMTRERRVEANARERQRVHTITAAFDTLQAAIPTEEKDIKLSKLSVIKIATAYIMALSRMAGHDYTEDQSAPPVEEVVEHCSEVIEKECRIKKRNGSQ